MLRFNSPDADVRAIVDKVVRAVAKLVARATADAVAVGHVADLRFTFRCKNLSGRFGPIGFVKEKQV